MLADLAQFANPVECISYARINKRILDSHSCNAHSISTNEIPDRQRFRGIQNGHQLLDPVELLKEENGLSDPIVERELKVHLDAAGLLSQRKLEGYLQRGIGPSPDEAGDFLPRVETAFDVKKAWRPVPLCCDFNATRMLVAKFQDQIAIPRLLQHLLQKG